jgi:hypothetical protein
MSKKKLSNEELDVVLQAVALFPEGASIEKIIGALQSNLTRRTLQRRLMLLAKRNLLQIEGQTRGRLYRLPLITTGKKSKISISPTAQSIQIKVTQPLHTRTHVSYNRDFLDKYRPNVIHYLPVAIRAYLFELGNSPVAERPAGTYARQILNRLLIDLSWNSSRLEGNTYSLLETKHLLELGEIPNGKTMMEAQMILNHKAAIEFLVESAETTGFNRYTILNLHALLSNNLLSDPGACGRLRSIPVGIGESVYHPLAVPQLISECFQQILDTAQAIEDPFEQAFFAMVHLPYLQPFEDVNKRVSRLAANLPLIRHNLCPLSFVDVPEKDYISGLIGVYELNRIELLRDIFIWAYERSCLLYSVTRNTLGEPDPFRLKYRDLIMEMTTRIVRLPLDLKSATGIIEQQARDAIPLEDQARFIEIIEAEIKGLHEGNIARYKIRPSEYEAWRSLENKIVTS